MALIKKRENNNNNSGTRYTPKALSKLNWDNIWTWSLPRTQLLDDLNHFLCHLRMIYKLSLIP